MEPKVLGLDIGGAHIKAALFEARAGTAGIRVAVRYHPVWRKREGLAGAIRATGDGLAADPDAVGVTMTAELSDAYSTKEEGVEHILDCVEEGFPTTPTYVLDVDANLLTVQQARRSPMRVAAANWAATGWLVSRHVPDCIVVDVGSTSTSIVPILGGRLAAAGKNDLEKLVNGELVYTGALRTPVAAIVRTVPLGGGVARVSSERFALSGDVHLVLGHLSERDYTTETADGRGKSRREALARLSRVVCADLAMLGEGEVVEMARCIYEGQLEQIAGGLRQVYERVKDGLGPDPTVVVTGLGRRFLGEVAARRAGFGRVVDLEEVVKGGSLATPAVGLALMVAERCLIRGSER